MTKNILAFTGALLIALGGWAESFESYEQALKINNMGSLLAVMGGVIVAWNVRRPKDTLKNGRGT